MSNPEDVTTGLPVDAADADATARERDELRDRLIRTTADFDNYRKRTDRERRELSEFVAADVIRDILPVLDDLERALGTPIEEGPAAAKITAYRDGLALIHRQFVEALRRRGVEALDVVGQDFNPEWHEALGSDPLNGRRDGEITAEIRKGYRIGSKLLRPAMVKVAQA
jgi:molecular chaperone GrpE